MDFTIGELQCLLNAMRANETHSVTMKIKVLAHGLPWKSDKKAEAEGRAMKKKLEKMLAAAERRDRFNRAADYVVNNIISRDPELKRYCQNVEPMFDGMTTEEVYTILEREGK